MRHEDVQLCESCGRYLYLPDPVAIEVPASVEVATAATKEAKAAVKEAKAASKTAAKPRKRRALAHAV
jgi:hypothetical protein